LIRWSATFDQDMSDLTIEEKLGQMLVVGFQGHEAPPHIIEWLGEGRIGGVILFARNIDTPAQLRALTQELRQAAGRPILVAIDQEGGAVARLREGFTESPGAMALGAADDPRLTGQVSRVLAAEMRAVGVNWNLAPAIDLTHDIRNPSVGTRSLGSDPEHVTRHALAQIKGLQEKGVAATAKHFPGKANTPVDPHVDLPIIEGSLDEMWGTDLAPFRAACAAGVSAVMVTHAQFRDIEPNYPSTMSSRIIQGLLRERIGFSGLVTTDCMEMKAITNRYGPGESAVLAAVAGADIILFSHTREYQEAAYEALLEAARSGRLPLKQVDDSVRRIDGVKARFPAYPLPPLTVIRSPKHLATVRRAARAGTVLLRKEHGCIPLPRERRCGLVEFASPLEKERMKQDTKTTLAAMLGERLPRLRSIWIDPTDPTSEQLQGSDEIAGTAEAVIIATRNAHLNPRQLEAAKRLLGRSGILVCLRNPYDAGVINAGSVLLTLGDSAPSLRAAADALVGTYVPTGRLNVPLTT
jgi:beta-N-acetylhexosaminidase